MISAHFLEFAALALAVTGLAAVIGEIALKDSTLFKNIVTDVRGLTGPARRAPRRRRLPLTVSWNKPGKSDELRKAA